jgi:hypothetical protein
VYDGRRSGEAWRQPLANAFKYSSSLLVQLISIFGGVSLPQPSETVL